MKVSTLKEIIANLKDDDDICCDIYAYEWASNVYDDDEVEVLTKDAWAEICNQYDVCEICPDIEWVRDAILDKLGFVSDSL
jgi:hypothetical protein